MSTSDESSTFVLLHGGRHGGWCWRDVARGLRAAGHDVHTPTLTGLGERSHLLNRDIGLTHHIDDLVRVFDYEDIQDAVLVAHSYGGAVASGAMEEIADRVRLLVFLDALMPRTGESIFDMIGPKRTQRMVELANDGGEGWFLPTSDAAWWGVTDPEQAAWVNSKTTPQPLKTYRDRIGTTDRAWGHPGAFIECQPSSLEPHMLERPRERAKADPQFSYCSLPTGHDAMITAPDAVTNLLLESLPRTRLAMPGGKAD